MRTQFPCNAPLDEQQTSCWLCSKPSHDRTNPPQNGTCMMLAAVERRPQWDTSRNTNAELLHSLVYRVFYAVPSDNNNTKKKKKTATLALAPSITRNFNLIQSLNPSPPFGALAQRGSPPGAV